LKSVILIASIALLWQACLFGKKDDPTTCRNNDECASKVCNLASYYCEPVIDSGQQQGGTVGTGGTVGFGGSGGEPVDASGGSSSEAGTIIDAPMDQRVPDGAVDTRVPDASGTCGTSADCIDPTRAFCVGNVCVGCSTDVQCQSKSAALPACGSDGRCVQCTATSSASCTGTTSACDTKTNTCVQCVAATSCSGTTPVCGTTDKCQACAADTDCAGLSDLARAACAASGACVQCTATNATKCTGTTPACDTTTNNCVQCTSAAYCSGATPICGTSEKCQACAADTECAALNDPTRVACVTTGACVQCTATNSTKCTGTTTVCNTTTNKCVQCLTNSTCSGTSPICATSTNTCRGCTAASDCSSFTGHTACASSGSCVQCTDNSTCSGTTPICATSTNTCRKCSTDGECSAIGPGVCMADGHCATDAETVYVGPVGSTCSDANAGTAQAPVCSSQAGVGLATQTGSSKSVVLVRGTLAAGSTLITASSPLTIVGKSSAVLTPTTVGSVGITVTSGEIYLRNLTVQGTASPATGMGINAISGTTLHMDTCAVINNPGGGILFNGAAFDIKNTTITGNGPGTAPAGASYGGIRVEALPAGGPTTLDLVTIQNNKQVGLSCSGAITGIGVLASGNNNNSTSATDQIGSTCAITACTPASTTCGVQSQPQ